MKIFSAQLKGTTTVAEGADVSLTGSFSGSIAGIDINSNNEFTASTIARLDSIETISSSNDARVNSLESFTSSTSARLNSIETISASNLSRLDSLEAKTGSLASTGSNTFYGTQVFSGSVYVKENLIVQGSSSLQNITASAVDIGTNKIILNVNNPSVRYAGISVYDSGSTAGTGSLFWDSVNNYWLYEHPADSGAPYNSAILISGPKNEGNLGEESGLVTNYIVKAVGSDHISSSAIYDDGTTISLKSNTEVTGSFKLTSNVTFGLTGDRSIGWGGNTQASAVNPIIYSDNNYLALNSKAGSKLYLNYDNTNASSTVDFFNSKVVIKSDGSVGMGTNNPTQPLSVKGGIHSDVSYTNGYYGAWLYGDTSGSSQSFLGLGVWYSQAGYVKWYDNTRLAIYTYANDKAVTLQETGGNVGVGTSNPSNTMHVFASGSTTMFKLENTTPNAYQEIGFFGDTSSNAFIFKGNSAYGSYGGANALNIYSAGAIAFHAGAVTNTTTFKSNGFVGIGTTNPLNPLQINTSTLDAGLQVYNSLNGDNGSTPIFLSHNNTAASIKTVSIEGTGAGNFAIRTGATGLNQYGTERLYINGSNGKVGINTANPISQLHVESGTTTGDALTLSFTTGADGRNTSILFKGGAYGYARIIGGTKVYGPDEGFIAFETSTPNVGGNVLATRMYINGNGYVGINDSNPQTRFSINGANYVEMATFTTVNNSSIIANNSGYVSSFTARHNSNSNVLSPTTNGIQILKAGIIHVNVAQDIRTTGTTGYAYLHIRKNETTISENLITNTNSEWDMINGHVTVDVAANDVINFYYSAADILSLDVGSWSQYSFIWTSR